MSDSSNEMVMVTIMVLSGRAECRFIFARVLEKGTARSRAKAHSRRVDAATVPTTEKTFMTEITLTIAAAPLGLPTA